MELVYLWINKTKNNIFEKQEINLTSKYSISYDAGSSRITITNNEGYYNIFKKKVISNVTAIVGANGVGKTTLLNYIMDNDVLPSLDEERKEYTQANEEDAKCEQVIQVFEKEGRVLVFHNLTEELVTDYDAAIIKVNTSVFRYMLDQQVDLNSLTKIYLTNGNYYYNNGYSSEESRASKIYLTNESIKGFCKGFYENCVQFPKGLIVDNYYNGLQNILFLNKKETDFQAICDIVYFNKLLASNTIASFAGKVSTQININCNVLPTILHKIKDKVVLNYSTNHNYKERIEVKEIVWRKYIAEMGDGRDDISLKMKLNLILELDFVFDILTHGLIKDAISIQDIFNKVKSTLSQICKPEYIEYYGNAIKEVEDFEQIISQCEYEENMYPKGDLAYKKEIVIKYVGEGDNRYEKFIQYIDRLSRARCSFVLKYIHIDNLNMSSGERAYLNLFSWINLTTFFNQIMQVRIEPLKENILLVIDEIEIYSHPEWQRKFIKNLLEELTYQFPNNKIQLVFATHSPIVLSDIPCSNTVYIKRDANSRVVIDDREKHNQTFAANIHRLFDDTFFLESKGAVGEFARDTINKVYRELKGVIDSKISRESLNRERIKYIIDSIGEPVVKNRLLDMYEKVYVKEEEKLIELYSKRVLQLKSQIADGTLTDTTELMDLRTHVLAMLAAVDGVMEDAREKNDKD